MKVGTCSIFSCVAYSLIFLFLFLRMSCCVCFVRWFFRWVTVPASASPPLAPAAPSIRWGGRGYHLSAPAGDLWITGTYLFLPETRHGAGWFPRRCIVCWFQRLVGFWEVLPADILWPVSPQTQLLTVILLSAFLFCLFCSALWVLLKPRAFVP